jgi:hypothetical protein
MMDSTISFPQEGIAPSPVVNYNDRSFRFSATLVVAFLVTSYGGEGLFAVLLTSTFYLEFAVTLLFTALLVEWISFATKRLDHYYDWETRTSHRLLFQIFAGVIVPGFMEFALAAAYFNYFGISILETTFLNFAFPLIMMLILLFNLYYFSFFIFLRWKQAQQSIGRLAGQLRVSAAVEDVEYFAVPFGGDQLSIPTSEILYFYREEKNNYARTLRGDTYIIPQTLDELEKMLNQGMFFRLNRQVIANFSCCKSYSDAGYGKLQVELNPAVPLEGSVIISQRKSPKFKGWMEKAGVAA